jgi:hypothetical protein
MHKRILNKIANSEESDFVKYSKENFGNKTKDTGS